MESVGVDQPPGSDGIELDDLKVSILLALKIPGCTLMALTGSMVMSLLVMMIGLLATLKLLLLLLLMQRINDGGADGGLPPILFGPMSYKAGKIEVTADGDAKKFSETKIEDNILQVLIAAGVYDVSATIDSLNWDQKAEKFTVVIKNPSSEDKFIDEVISTLASVTRVEMTSTGSTPKILHHQSSAKVKPQLLPTLC